MSELWISERRLWLDGVSAYEELMAGECVMAFGQIGVLSNAEIVESLKEGPSWSEVEISDRTEIRSADNVAVIAYRARAYRDSDIYDAICTSTYVCVDGYWWIAQHQQTPLST